MAEVLQGVDWQVECAVEEVGHGEVQDEDVSAVVLETKPEIDIIIILTTNNIFRIEAVSESSYNYSSSAIAQDTSVGFIPSRPLTPINTIFKVFNAPTLKNKLLDSSVIYYCASGETTGWRGCEVFKSINMGQTYSTINAIFGSSLIATASTALSSGPTTIWDLDNSITISLISYTEPTAVTLQQVLTGKNYLKVGDEIIQYADVVDNGSGSFTLSTLLRGRLGTEWAIDTHIIGEDIIGLTNNLQF